MFENENPYAAPSALGYEKVTAEPAYDELARRFTRFVASLVDGLLLLGFILPVPYAAGVFQRAQTSSISFFEDLLMSLLGAVAMLVLNGYLLYSRGQTIGKFITRIQIVDFESGHLLPFLRVYVFRYLWTLPFEIMIALIPWLFFDMAFCVIILVDTLMIFGVSRRCLHDLFAGSKVVLYQADRPHLS